MRPAASVCGFYFAHPQARYFALGKIGRDQVEDYHRRKGMDLATRRALARAEPGVLAAEQRLSRLLWRATLAPGPG